MLIHFDFRKKYVFFAAFETYLFVSVKGTLLSDVLFVSCKV